MKHDYKIAGPSYSLRPVNDNDISFICELRGNVALNKYIHAGEVNEEKQAEWMSNYYSRENDYYFVIIENNSLSPCGLISAYNVTKYECEWGRWIIKPGSMCALESAWLIYKFCFDTLNLTEVYCRTVSNNKRVIAFHNSMNIRISQFFESHFDINGFVFDAIEHRLTSIEWEELQVPITKKLNRLALYN